jgi:hypothetical protein
MIHVLGQLLSAERGATARATVALEAVSQTSALWSTGGLHVVLQISRIREGGLAQEAEGGGHEMLAAPGAYLRGKGTYIGK